MTRVEEISTVCFVGSGVMGCWNAVIAAAAGYDAVLHDVSAESLAAAPARLEGIAASLVARGVFDAAAMEPAIGRIHCEAEASAAVAEADLLSESVPETLELKREVHARFDALCPSHTLLTTNTSSLVVSQIEDAVERGARFAAFHSHLGTSLVDVVAGARTSASTVDLLVRYARSFGGVPLVGKKERPGYLFNGMFHAVMRTGLWLAANGQASPEDVDRAWMTAHGTEAGPFGWIDFVGLDLVYQGQLRSGESAMVELLRPYAESGQLGSKTGRGFYSYPEPSYAAPDFLTSKAPQMELAAPMTNALHATALVLAAGGYAEPEDVDRAWMCALSTPSGPFGQLDEIGLAAVADGVADLAPFGAWTDKETDAVRVWLAPYVASKGGVYTYPDPAYGRPGFVLG
jgi:enoyl-CoA hydratase/3-hydroxyacyl-CoA dehydrogenase